MAELSHGQRIDRLERVVEILAEDQLTLQKIVTEMATEMRRGFDRVAHQFDELREADERIRGEMRERARYYDERVDKLVLAIGEYLRRNPNQAS